MYNVIYNIPFTNVDGESLNVQILENGGSGSPVELTGGTPPFIVDYNNEDFLYTPARFSGATLKIVGGDYLQRLFSTDYQKFKVNLTKNGSAIWTGFITPEVYSQDFDNSLFELEIECISALSTLEYIDFKWDDDLISLLEIINKCITESKGDFNAVYIPKVYSTDINTIEVSKANFFDEKDKAMTLKECLEEVCKFLNWTVFEYESSVYFIDVDYINKGNTAYTNILNNKSVTLSSSINLRNTTSKGNGNSLSILGGYNKVTVIDSDYEADSDKLYPEMAFDAMGGINYVEKSVDGKMYQKYWCYYPTDFKLHNYTWTGSAWRESTQTEIDQDNDKNLAGVYPVKTTNYSIDDMPNSLTYTNEFEIHQRYKTNTDKYLYSDNGIYKMIEVSDTFEANSIIIDSDYKFAVDFQIARCVSDERLVYDVEQISGDVELEPVKVPMSLNIGNYWYNGSTWQTSECRFEVPVTFKRNQLMNTYVSCDNTNSFIYNVEDLNGYLIHIDRVLIGKPTLTIYNPIDPYYTLFTELHARSYFIKDIELQCQKIGTSSLNEEEKEDTKYENVVNEEYINECDDIEFKITSKNDSELSYSKAILNGSILDKIRNSITNTDEKPEELLIKRVVEQYNQPKIKLLQIIKPETKPYSVVTDPTYLSGKKFIFTGGTVDYEDNSIECNLIELN